jgi:hypothetical protein
MKEVMVRPAKFRNREDRDQARALLARKVLWELLAAARSQVGPLRWLNEGGLEAEGFLEALDAGYPHPLLDAWRHKKRTAGRPPASARERHAQRIMCLATVALERAISLGVGEAREIVAERAKRLFEPPPTAKKIEHWQEAQLTLLSAADEQVLARAISSSRIGEPGDRERLADYFVGIAHLALTPGTRVGTV